MNAIRWLGTLFFVCTPGCLPLIALPQSAPAAAAQAGAMRDGQHDFDFNIGTWHTHIRMLQHPLSGSDTWLELDGTVVVRSVWKGWAELEEIEAEGPNRHFEGLTLFLYNPAAHQWSQVFANSNDGTLQRPAIGEFKNGRGEFFDQESFKGREILVRGVWSDITKDSHRFEQSYSDDGGKTWESNFIGTLSRQKTAEARTGPAATAPPSAGQSSGQRDFDFNFGTWKTHVSRLVQPLAGATQWVDYDGNSVVSKVWNGRASLFELDVNGPAGHIEGVGLRLYNPQSHQWSLNWANGRDGVMTQPMIGEFKDRRGEFFDQETFNGRSILARNGFSDITPTRARFEQAFSDDGGKTWETNWKMTFTR
jgi:hypothetical protein